MTWAPSLETAAQPLQASRRWCSWLSSWRAAAAAAKVTASSRGLPHAAAGGTQHAAGLPPTAGTQRTAAAALVGVLDGRHVPPLPGGAAARRAARAGQAPPSSNLRSSWDSQQVRHRRLWQSCSCCASPLGLGPLLRLAGGVAAAAAMAWVAVAAAGETAVTTPRAAALTSQMSSSRPTRLKQCSVWSVSESSCKPSSCKQRGSALGSSSARHRLRKLSAAAALAAAGAA